MFYCIEIFFGSSISIVNICLKKKSLDSWLSWYISYIIAIYLLKFKPLHYEDFCFFVTFVGVFGHTRWEAHSMSFFFFYQLICYYDIYRGYTRTSSTRVGSLDKNISEWKIRQTMTTCTFLSFFWVVVIFFFFSKVYWALRGIANKPIKCVRVWLSRGAGQSSSDCFQRSSLSY